MSMVDGYDPPGDEIRDSHQALFEQIPELEAALNEQQNEWQAKLNSELEQRNPYTKHKQKLSDWRRQPLNTEAERDSLLQDFDNFNNDAGVPQPKNFWEGKFELMSEDEQKANEIAVARRALLANWQRSLQAAERQWHQEQYKAARMKFIDQMKQRLAQVAEVRQALSGLGLDPSVWFDLGDSKLSQTDMDQFKQWAEFLRNNEGAKKICELLGRLRHANQVQHIEEVKTARWVSVQTIDTNSREEIIGIRLGNELEHVLPSDLALLADHETSILFDVKYLESRLHCFEMQGITTELVLQHGTEFSVRLDEEKLGPMVLCIDTSGSMAGKPEQLAKAMALYLTMQAHTAKRRCYIINFATDIQCFDATEKGRFKELMKFLSRSFGGGTDAAPALRHGISMLNDENYKKADLLMISDFVCNRVPSDLLEQIGAQRRRGNRFLSLVISTERSSSEITHFDQEWIFDPDDYQIRELAQLRV